MQRRQWAGYVVAVVSTFITLLLHLALNTMLGGRPTLVIFSIPIMISAYLGGLGPGLLATLISYLAASYYLLAPVYSFRINSSVEIWQQIFVILAGVVISVLNEALHRARRRVAYATVRYSRLFEYAPDGIVFADGKSTYLDANRSICQMLGYSRNELIGMNASDIVVPAEIKNIELALDDIKIRSDHHREWQFRRKDGSTFDAEVMATSMPDGNLLGVIRDITERKKFEAAAAHLVAIVNSSEDAIIGKDLSGIVTSWNYGAEKIFGYSVNEMLGKPIARIIPSEYQKEEADIIDNIQHGQNVRHFDTVRLRKDGSRIDIALTVSPIKDSAGNIVGASKVARDIRERKKAEKEIQQLHAELERRVIERTAQLEAANRELEAFSYSVSHDLRAPLRAVDGFSQAVLEDFGPQLPPEGHRQLQVIRESAQRMGNLIDDLLKFSRLSRLPLCKTNINTEALVLATLSELKTQQGDRQIQITVGVFPLCQGDSALLKQVWTNLLSNAFKYSGKRAKSAIEIGCENVKGENVYFVRDNGCGFDMRYAEKLFSVFHRLHRAEDYEGTGVGLAIVQRIVSRHGGRIWAESSVDRGATFSFTLEGGSIYE